MLALHVSSWARRIASLFGRGDAARRALPMTPEELLEAGVLDLRGLGMENFGAGPLSTHLDRARGEDVCKCY